MLLALGTNIASYTTEAHFSFDYLASLILQDLLAFIFSWSRLKTKSLLADFFKWLSNIDCVC